MTTIKIQDQSFTAELSDTPAANKVLEALPRPARMSGPGLLPR
jgi:hypothetical protein